MVELLRRLLFLPPGASSVADGIDELHASIIGAALLISIVLFATASVFVARGRRRSPRALTERVEATTRREITIASVVTLAFVAWWVVGFRQYSEMTSPPPGAEVVYVEAKQWTWKFAHGGGRAENDVLTVPAGKPVQLVMTSRDVIHSLYVPAFRLKQDVVPGRYTSLWFVAGAPGTYPIWCAEYCGLSHSAMTAEVHVVPADEYEAWKRATDATASSWVDRGREVASKRGCVACHSPESATRNAPSLHGIYGTERALADGRKVRADEAYLTRALAEPNADVVAGYRPVMPSYQGILTSDEVAALLALVQAGEAP